MLNTGIFTGFVDLEGTDINTLHLEKKEDFPTHALVYFVSRFFFKFKVQFIGVLRIHSNIYDGAF